MKNSFICKIGFALLAAMFLPGLASAQKATITISSIKPEPSLAATLRPDNKLEMGRIIDSLADQLHTDIQATHKFDVVDNSDMSDALKQQDLGASGNADSKTAPQIGKITVAKYLVRAKVDDFQDYFEKASFAGTGDTATKRIFRFSVTVDIEDSATTKSLATASFTTGNDQFKQIQQEHNYSVKNGELSDDMMTAISRDMAQKVSDRVLDVLFPIKFLIRNDSGVTINRGDGGGVAVGDVFNVFALGKPLIDPDTGEKLGNEEVKVGQVKITEVDPAVSKAQIVQDTGIDTGAILRKPQ
jgi:hypothetical protein